MAGVGCVRDWLFALLRYIKEDFLELLLNVFFILIIGVFAYIFKGDVFGGLQAFRAFDLSDKSLSYVHRSSVISGNENIILSTFYGVRAGAFI